MNPKVLVILILMGFSFFGCERDPMRNARIAHSSGNLEKSAMILDQILKNDSGNFEASRLYADIHMSRNEFDVAEKKLLDLWVDGGFVGELDRPLEKRISRKHLEAQFGQLYRQWLEKIDSKKKPDFYEEVALRGLKQNPENALLTQKLITFYFAEADSLVDGNEKIAAANVFSKILDLQGRPQQLEDARIRSLKLRKDIFREKAIHHFEKNILPDLRENGRWEPAKRIIRFALTGTLDRKLKLRKDGDLDSAKQTANLELSRKISSMMQALASSEVRVSKSKLAKYKITSEKYTRGRFGISADVSFEDLLEASFELGNQPKP